MGFVVSRNLSCLLQRSCTIRLCDFSDRDETRRNKYVGAMDQELADAAAHALGRRWCAPTRWRHFSWSGILKL